MNRKSLSKALMATALCTVLLATSFYFLSPVLFPADFPVKVSPGSQPPPGVEVDALSDRELLNYLAGPRYCRWPIEPLKERASHYTEAELAELSALIVEIAFPLRPEYEFGLGFLAITDRYLPLEWAYYTYDEGMKKRREHTQPVVDFVRAQRSPTAKRTPETLEQLRVYYIALDDPARYPQLRPQAYHCGMGDPDVWNLQEDILKIFGESGADGVDHLHWLGYKGPHLGKALMESGRPQDVKELVDLITNAPTESEGLVYLSYLDRMEPALRSETANDLLRNKIGRDQSNPVP